MAFSNLEKALLAWVGIETTRPGTLTPITRKAAQAAFVGIVKGAQMAGRGSLPVAARALPPVARAVANPYVGIPLGVAAAGYGTQQYLEESGRQEEINVAYDEFLASLQPTAVKAKKRVRSTYNRAVSKAMKAVKASAKAGPKGTITNAKKTFGTVSKAVSRAKKGGKLSPKGVTGVVKRAIAGMFKPKPKRRTSSKGSYTITTRKS